MKILSFTVQTLGSGDSGAYNSMCWKPFQHKKPLSKTLGIFRVDMSSCPGAYNAFSKLDDPLTFANNKGTILFPDDSRLFLLTSNVLDRGFSSLFGIEQQFRVASGNVCKI